MPCERAWMLPRASKGVSWLALRWAWYVGRTTTSLVSVSMAVGMLAAVTIWAPWRGAAGFAATLDAGAACGVLRCRL